MANFNLNFFGGFRLMKGEDQEIHISSKKGQALLAYLALNQKQQHTRDKMMALLWPDRGEKQARHSLRQELLSLNKILNDGSQLIVTEADRLSIESKAISVDVRTFERLAKQGTPEALEQAASLYVGDLLDGSNFGGSELEQWCSGERARLKDKACNVLERFAEARAIGAELDSAIEVAQKLALLDPLRERAHRLLMRLYNQAGRRSDALRQYQLCVNILRRELDVEPQADTLRLHEEIHNKQTEAKVSTDATENLQTLPLPSKPSIAVLPFDNLSGVIDQEYFADGITEDIITTLGRFRWFFVIAHNSTLTYKDKPVEVKRVARELGVRYVLEGSVRKAGERVRITAELSDTTSGQHIWSEHYDRKLTDIFAMQDEISKAVVASVTQQFLSAEADRARRKDPSNFDAWDYCIRGRWHLWRFNKPDNAAAKKFLRRSIELDSNFAPALADLASLHVIDALFGWNRTPLESLEIARTTADKALHYDDQDAWAHAVVGLVDAISKSHEQGISRLERAIEINPNFAAAYGFLGWAEIFVGNTNRAVSEIEKAIRLSPRDPFIMLWHTALAGAAFVEGCYEDAARWARRAIVDRKDFPSVYRILAASLGLMDKMEEARAAVREILRLIPDQTLTNVKGQLPYGDPEVIDRFVEGLRKGGLPE